MRSRLFAALLGASALTLAACGGGGGSKSASTSNTTSAGSSSGLASETASFDLAVGPPARYMIGLFTNDKQGVAYGSVQVRFCFAGATKAEGACEFGAPQTATFLATPGVTVDPAKTAPEAVSPSGPKGVYVTQVGFDKAGIWRAHVDLDLNGKPTSSETSFQVLDKHAITNVGDAALATDSLTMTTPNTPPAAIDSRASAGGLVPDPEIHQQTIAAAIAAHRPTVIVFSSPVYCISRFCGPITDMVQSLSKTYGDRASFIHVEIWNDYQKQTANKAATDWLYRNDTLTEPWVFLVGADGKVSARWDNIATQPEIEPLLQKLPVIGK